MTAPDTDVFKLGSHTEVSGKGLKFQRSLTHPSVDQVAGDSHIVSGAQYQADATLAAPHVLVTNVIAMTDRLMGMTEDGKDWFGLTIQELTLHQGRDGMVLQPGSAVRS